MPYQPGEVLLNKYKIEKMLGEGAFGEVYLATHIQLGAKRALKVLRRDAPGMGSTFYKDCQERFRREAQLGAAINNNNVIRVHNLEELDPCNPDGGYLLEMEYAPGNTLRDRLERAREQKKPLEVNEALRITLDVANGLKGIHTEDVVHRDIKPSNIFFGEDGKAKIGDLGLAQIPGGYSRRSVLGSLADPHPGTPAYMSPEQETTTQYLKPSSDIYSLGIVLFEMLTLRNYKNLEPGARLRDLRKEVAPEVDELCAMMLVDTPTGRIWNGDKLAGNLEAILSPVASRRSAADRSVRGISLPEGTSGQTGGKSSAVDVDTRPQPSDNRKIQAQTGAPSRTPQIGQASKPAVLHQIVQPSTRSVDVKPGQGSGDTGKGGGSGWLWLGGAGLLGAAGLVLVIVVVVILLNRLNPTPVSPDNFPAVVSSTGSPEDVPKNIEAVEEEIPVSANTEETSSNNQPASAAEAQQATTRPSDTPEPAAPARLDYTAGDTRKRDKDGMTEVYIPAGSFSMGSDADSAAAECEKFSEDCKREDYLDEEPVHEVSLGAFWIDKTEVTNAMYEACVMDGPCTKPSYTYSATRTDYYATSQYVKYPVVWVSWHQAREYCDWVGGRLPTEAEWEKAARSEDRRTYPWGKNLDAKRANFCDKNCTEEWKYDRLDDGFADTAPVGSYPGGASIYGVLDMAGNVWEWTRDWYAEDYYKRSPAENPSGPTSGSSRVAKGGAWVVPPQNLRSSYRTGRDPNAVYGSYGFRCVSEAGQ